MFHQSNHAEEACGDLFRAVKHARLAGGVNTNICEHFHSNVVRLSTCVALLFSTSFIYLRVLLVFTVMQPRFFDGAGRVHVHPAVSNEDVGSKQTFENDNCSCRSIVKPSHAEVVVFLNAWNKL